MFVMNDHFFTGSRDERFKNDIDVADVSLFSWKLA
jgi:hypothetical protein